MVRERRLTKRQATSRPDHLWPELWRGISKNAMLREKYKWAIEEPKLDNARRFREIYFIDLEAMEIKEIIQNARRKLETPMVQRCLARLARKTSLERPAARRMTSGVNLREPWKPVNPQECVWKNLYRIIMRTILQGKGTIHCNITICYTNFSYASSHENSCSKGSSGQGMGKI